jgi:hypothetical protein
MKKDVFLPLHTSFWLNNVLTDMKEKNNEHISRCKMSLIVPDYKPLQSLHLIVSNEKSQHFDFTLLKIICKGLHWQQHPIVVPQNYILSVGIFAYSL